MCFCAVVTRVCSEPTTVSLTRSAYLISRSGTRLPCQFNRAAASNRKLRPQQSIGYGRMCRPCELARALTSACVVVRVGIERRMCGSWAQVHTYVWHTHTHTHTHTHSLTHSLTHSHTHIHTHTHTHTHIITHHTSHNTYLRQPMRQDRVPFYKCTFTRSLSNISRYRYI